MSRPRPPLNTELPYHISARCVHRHHFPIPLEEVWSIYENHLFLFQRGFGIQIHSFVLMPNHFHMLIRVPNGNLSQAMRYLMRESSLDINRSSGRINQNYGQRYHASLVDSYHYFLQAYKYVYQNPVRAKLSERVEDYPFSTLRFLLGMKKFAVPLEYDTVLFDSGNLQQTLDWLSEMPIAENIKIIRTGLRKSTFSIPPERGTRRPHSLETSLL